MVIERPSSINGGRLLIFGIDLQSWSILAALVLGILGLYLSMRNEVSSLKTDVVLIQKALTEHTNNRPNWAIELVAQVREIVEKNEKLETRVGAIDASGTRGLAVLSERLNYSMANIKEQLDQIREIQRETQKLLLNLATPHPTTDEFIKRRTPPR